MTLSVECCSGRKAGERPIRLSLGGRQYQVETVLASMSLTQRTKFHLGKGCHDRNGGRSSSLSAG